MKMKSLLSSNGVKHILFATFMLLPLISIFARTIYVQSNANAYQSYYGDSMKEVTYDSVTSFDDLVVGKTYRFDSANVSTYNDVSNKRIYVSNVNILFTNANNTEVQNLLTCEAFSTTYYDGVAYLIPIINGSTTAGINFSSRTLSFTFEFVSEIHPLNQSYTQCFDGFISLKVYNQDYYLDNAFEYSLSTFVEENNFNLNFFNWFDNLFLSFEGHNALYVNFINWYLNYALLVASVYLLFYVIYWFIDFVRGLLDKFSRKVGD